MVKLRLLSVRNLYMPAIDIGKDYGSNVVSTLCGLHNTVIIILLYLDPGLSHQIGLQVMFFCGFVM